MRSRVLAAGVVGAAALTLAGCGATAVPAAVPVVAPASLAVSPTRSAPAANPFAGQALISTTTWTTNAKGRELQVVPTAAGRKDFGSGEQKRAWSEVLAKAPDAGSPGMYDQFLCHWNYARVVEPDKPSWNLEPWRPAVGYARTVDALCNPGGSEG